MGSAKKKILFCHTGFATFVKTDYDILSQNYEVIAYHYKLSNSKMMKIANIFSSFFFALIWVWRVDVVYVWFGGYHGFFPVIFAKLLGKKSIMIVGGYDASYVPSIKYGIFYHNGFLLWCVKRTYNWATWICPVDESLVKSTNYYADPSGVGYRTGLLNHLDLDKKKIKVIHLGFDNEFSNEPLADVRKNIVLSIAYVNVPETFTEKGFHHVVEIARRMSNVEFWIGAFTPEMLALFIDKVPSNVRILPTGDYHVIKEYYHQAKVILHLSLTEGFCAVIAEGMLHGCVAIGSNVGGIKRSLGDVGFLIEKQEMGEMQNAVQNALIQANVLSSKSRARSMFLYHLSKRRELIYSMIEAL